MVLGTVLMENKVVWGEKGERCYDNTGHDWWPVLLTYLPSLAPAPSSSSDKLLRMGFLAVFKNVKIQRST